MKFTRPPPTIDIAGAATSGLTHQRLLDRIQYTAKERVCADADVIAQQFRREDRAAIRRFAAKSPNHADAAQQFSLLAYLLATRLVPTEQRQAAESAIAAGASLAKIAGIAGVPMWSRILPPAACIDPLGRLPQSANFACRISDPLRHRLDDDADLRGYLRAIVQAHETCGEEYAIWLACRYPNARIGDLPPMPLRVLALWYLVSKAGPGLARDLVHTRWRRDLSLETAVRASRNFARRIDLELLVGPRGIENPWYPAARVADLDFIPQTTSLQVRAEARDNDNCLDTYGQRLAANETRLYSVRGPNGQCVANVEISPSDAHAHVPRIAQIKAPGNQPAPPIVGAIADMWLHRMMNRHGMPDMRRALPRMPDAGRWDEITASLRAAGSLPAWATSCPSNGELEQIELEFSILGVRLQARTWRPA